MRLTIPLRHLADVWVSNVDKLTTEGEIPVRLCNYVDVYRNDTVAPHDGLMRVTARPEEMRRFRLEVGDTVLTKDSEDPTDIGISAYVTETADDFVCGYHLAIARPRVETHSRYLSWALRSQPVLDHFSVNANGISRYGLSISGLMATPIPIPAYEEQRRIADFLDDRVARIDQIITARENQVLQCKKARVAAVDSSLAGHGRLGRLKELLVASPCYGVLKPDYVDNGVPVVRITDLPSDGEVDVSALRMISGGQSIEYRRTTLVEGDLIIGVVGTLGRPTRVGVTLAGANVTRAVARIRLQPQVDRDYVLAALSGAAFQQFVDQVTQGTAQAVLNMADLKNLPLELPDSDHMRNLGAAARAARVSWAERERHLQASITLLAAYKQSLITAAVTGEFDVATASTRVPGG